MAAVIWALNYDLSQFDTVWTWLHSDVPSGPERSRAIGAAALIAVNELDRPTFLDEGVAAFDEAMLAFPDDARLSPWRASLVFVKARRANDAAAMMAAFEGLRGIANDYPSFTLFGVTVAVAGWESAPLELIEEARAAYVAVVADANRMKTSSSPSDATRSRRIYDTPVAPYNIPAMQAMIGDLELRAGKKAEAARAYYTALNSNNSNRWPWRAEIERRLKNLDSVAAGFEARPATESSIGAQSLGSMGISEPRADSRFGGRIGNGSCTVCHTHVSSFDLREPGPEIGWVRAKAQAIAGVRNLAAVGLLLPDGPNPVPAGFAIGPYVDVAAGPDFFKNDAHFDGTVMIPAPPGRYFVVMQSDFDGKKYQGYSAREFGKQRFIDVRAGIVADLSGAPIELTLKKDR